MKLDPLAPRTLGATGIPVTAVGLGGAGLGGIFGPVGDADGVAAVEAALELGVTYLDTSPKYGQAERRMGLALRGVPRDGYTLSSKVGTHPDRPGDYSADAARWTVERSLEVLGVDRLDICLIHEPEPAQLDVALADGGALEALVELKAAGVIGAIGLGVQDHALHRRAMATGELEVSLMVNDYTLMGRRLDDMIEPAAEARVSLINGAPLAMGLLSGRDPRSVGTPTWTPGEDEVRAAELVHTWCAGRGITVLALALQFSLAQSAFDCTLVGASTAAEVQGCWSALTEPLPDSVWEELPELLAAIDRMMPA